MNKLFRWLLGIMAIVGIVYYSIIKFVVPGYLAQVPPLVSNLAGDYITGSVDIARVEWNGALELSVFDVQVKDKQQQLIAVLPEVRLHISLGMPFSILTKPWTELLWKSLLFI